MVQFLWYPRCIGCRNAKKWLDEHEISYEIRHVAEDHPSYEELKEWHKKSGLPLKKFFHSTGALYKKMELEEKLSSMSEEEQLRLLSSNGLLIKRPLVIGEDFVLLGFQSAVWSDNL